MNSVPFLDLKRQYASIKSDIDQAIAGVFERGDFILGKGVSEFEERFAAACGVKHCVGVNAGTSALIIALRVMGIGKGDEVLLPSHTFIATAEAVHYVGALPVFVDIDPETYLMDLTDAERKVTSATKLIIPVHLYGQMVPMEPVLAFAQRHRLQVLEDACQAHGATQNGRQAGTFGIAGTFSFYPGKNLGAYGEGGALVTNDDRIAQEARAMRNHGCYERYVHVMLGYNMRMEGLQGAILAAKIPHLAAWNAARNEHATFYRSALAGVGDITCSKILDGNISNYHLFVIQTAQRDALQAFLNQRGVSTGIHYPIPVHLQKAFEHLGMQKGSLPFTEQVSTRILSLPLFPEMTAEERDYVVANVKDFFAQ